MLSIYDPLLIFTDLDGTLLNSHTFEWQPAAPWLTRLHESGVPVILCSSKTAAEMLQLQTTLNLQGLPLIAENGAVIQLDVLWEDHPNYPRLIAGISHNEIRLVLHKLREKEQFKFTTFDDVDDQVISEWTGLNRAQSALTRLHEASVSLIWRDSDERMAQFVARLNELGLQFVHGARFWHVLDASAGKDQAANWLIEAYRRQWRADTKRRAFRHQNLFVINALAYAFGNLQRLHFRRAGQHDTKLFAPYPSGDVVRSNGAANEPSGMGQHAIACLMTKAIVNAFKII